LREATQTAPHYRLHALPGTTPPKPGLLRVPDGGVAIAVEAVGHADRCGRLVPRADPAAARPRQHRARRRPAGARLSSARRMRLAGAADISAHGGWRAYLAEPASRRGARA
jgi:allophanate hydrolase